MAKDLRGEYQEGGATAVQSRASKVSEYIAPAGEREDSGPKPFPLIHQDDGGAILETRDFVEGLLVDGELSVVYGPPNCGKTFWILDLCAHVVMGRPWRDRQVEQGSAIYFALEGGFGVQNRVAALKQEGRLMPGMTLYRVDHALPLTQAGIVERLVETIREVNLREPESPVRIVVVDTLARAMSGEDENSGEAMSRLISAVDTVRAATGVHFTLIHHTGKDETRGARGHSSLLGNVDTMISISTADENGVHTATVTKQKNLDFCDPTRFSLLKVELGLNQREKPVTSRVVEHLEAADEPEARKPGRPYAAEDGKILNMLPQPGTAKWQKAVSDEYGISKATFYRALDRIKGAKSAFQRETGEWVLMVSK